MSTRKLIYSALLSVLIEPDTKRQLQAIARVKQRKVSPLVRSILFNTLPTIVEGLTEHEKRAYDTVLQEFELEEQHLAEEIAGALKEDSISTEPWQSAEDGSIEPTEEPTYIQE